MKTVWITGANGLIGGRLAQSAPGDFQRVRALTRADFDLLDFKRIADEFQKDRPQLVIHCAALTVVAEVQKNPGLARRVNTEATQFLAELSTDIPFIFFSTDIIFDGRKGNYLETDQPNPLHVYGETKVAAERLVLKNPRHLVVRTSLNAGASQSGNRAFNEQLRRSFQQAGDSMTLFRDEFRCPIAAAETALAVWELAQKGCSGIYHVAGAEKLSRLEIGQLLLARWPEIKTGIKSGSARDFACPPRALDTSLDIAKAQKVLSRPLPKFSEWLAAHPAERI
jgi:dTDP-4-dehydrorhamnose reductase